MIRVASIDVADPPELWQEIGFEVRDGVAQVGTVDVRLGGAGDGVTAWTLTGVPDAVAGSVDGLVTRVTDEALTRQAVDHPNGVESIDHVVVMTPDMDRTVEALGAIGLELRRRRETERVVQCFFRLGEVILEVVGGAPGSPKREGPARFYGLAFTARDLDATAAAIGPLLHPPKEAVQPGRRIATLDRRAGSTVPLAFMSQEPAATNA